MGKMSDRIAAQQRAARLGANGAAEVAPSVASMPREAGISGPDVAGQGGRRRLQFELSADIDRCLESVSEVLGMPKAQIALQALVQALPGLISQAEQVRAVASSPSRRSDLRGG